MAAEKHSRAVLPGSRKIHENDERGAREHARETDIAGEHQHDEPAAEDGQEQPRIERPDDADHGRDALAAAKAEPDRIHVPDDHGEAAGECKPVARDLRDRGATPGNEACGK